MVENSDTSYENKIHRVDSPSNEDSKNVTFCHGGPKFRLRDMPENLEKMAQNREVYCYAN